MLYWLLSAFYIFRPVIQLIKSLDWASISKVNIQLGVMSIKMKSGIWVIGNSIDNSSSLLWEMWNVKNWALGYISAAFVTTELIIIQWSERDHLNHVNTLIMQHHDGSNPISIYINLIITKNRCAVSVRQFILNLCCIPIKDELEIVR